MNKIVPKGILVFSSAVFLASCANTASLTKISSHTAQINPTLASPAPVQQGATIQASNIQTPIITVDWQKIEATADQLYEDEPLTTDIFFLLSESESTAGSAADFYAKEFNVSIEEAQRRLILQGISAPLIEAVARELGEAIAGIYYDNNNPNEYSVNFITLKTVQAEPLKYVYQFKHKDYQYYSFPIYIKPSSNATQPQILALQEKASPEIFRRYPDTQLIGYSPASNTINVSIYTKTPDEAERKRIEAELTELVGHPVKVEFMSGRITTM